MGRYLAWGKLTAEANFGVFLREHKSDFSALHADWLLTVPLFLKPQSVQFPLLLLLVSRHLSTNPPADGTGKTIPRDRK